MSQPTKFLKFRGALYRKALQMVQSPGTGEPNRKPHQRPLVQPSGKDPSGARQAIEQFRADISAIMSLLSRLPDSADMMMSFDKLTKGSGYAQLVEPLRPVIQKALDKQESAWSIWGKVLAALSRLQQQQPAATTKKNKRPYEQKMSIGQAQRRLAAPALPPEYNIPVTAEDLNPEVISWYHSSQGDPIYALGSRLQAYGETLASEEELKALNRALTAWFRDTQGPDPREDKNFNEISDLYHNLNEILKHYSPDEFLDSNRL